MTEKCIIEIAAVCQEIIDTEDQAIAPYSFNESTLYFSGQKSTAAKIMDIIKNAGHQQGMPMEEPPQEFTNNKISTLNNLIHDLCAYIGNKQKE